VQQTIDSKILCSELRFLFDRPQIIYLSHWQILLFMRTVYTFTCHFICLHGSLIWRSCIWDMKIVFKILVEENEGKSQLGKSKRRMADNIKMVLGDLCYQTVGSINLYQKSCLWWLWFSKQTFNWLLNQELNFLAITNFHKMSMIGGLSMIHLVTKIISLEGRGKAIAKHKTIAYRGNIVLLSISLLRHQHVFSCCVHANATVTSLR